MPFSMMLLDQIEQNDPSITKIELRPFPPITDNDIRELVEAAQRGNNTSLKTLCIADSKISDTGAKLIATHLSQLEVLRLGGSNMGNKGAVAIAEKMTQLKALTLSGNKIGDLGAKALAHAKSKTLTSLTLSGNPISNEGVHEFLQNKTLTELNFQRDGTISLDLLERLREHTQKNKKGMKEVKAESSLHQVTSDTKQTVLSKKKNINLY